MTEKGNGCTVIAGCGRLGATIAGKLSEKKKDVVILDCDKTAFRKLPYYYGGLTLTVDATDIEKLKTTDLCSASVFIALTNHDCVNICCAQIAKNVFHIPKVVARIYDEEKIALVNDMGIDVICPGKLSEKEIRNYIEIGSETHVE
ncbi:NAD-binding protein [Floccifex sp.]|uniref:NAD-binding protein n=1 Tax=Floccifex sp. TaxID=2815810 RepID=UPI003F052E65